MKTLIVHPTKGYYGGAETVVVQLSNYLVQQGVECRVILKDAPKEMIDNFINKGAVINTKDWYNFRGWVQTAIKWFGVAIVNVHNFPSTLATFPHKVPTIWYCNEPPELFTSWWRKPLEVFNRWWVQKSGMKVVVADDYNANRFERLYGIRPETVPYGVDYEFWSRGIRNRAGFTLQPEGALRLLQVGTISEYKNQRASVRLLDFLRNEKKVDAILTFVGRVADAVYYKHLLKDIEFRDLVPFVKFLGQISKEEVRELFYKHDILLHPVKGQGGWLVPFEACCTDIKVIVSRNFQAADFFGCWIEDIESVLGYIKGPEEDILMHQPSKKWVKENLTWEKFGEGMLSIFEEAVQKRKRLGRERDG